MPRRNRRSGFSVPPRPLASEGVAYLGTVVHIGPDGEDYQVRHMGAVAARKFYICPGCNQNIPPGTAHMVVWPKDFGHGAEDRRHWHRGCWERARR